MDVSGVLKGVEGNADKIGMVLGAWSDASLFGGGDGMAGLSIIISGLVKDPHIPDIGHVAKHLFSGGGRGIMMSALGAAVIGWLLKEIDVHPVIGRVGNLVMKLGMGAAGGIVATDLLIFSGTERSEGADAGLGGGSHFGFLSGSRHNPHGAYSEPSVAPMGTRLTRSGPGSPNPYT